MKIGKKGLALIKKWEGCELEAYRDVKGIPTIGYGHIQGVNMGDTITKKEAEELLLDDLDRFERAVTNHVNVEINQNQFDACCSLAFNIGIGAFKSSTLLRLLNLHNFPGAADQFLRWKYAGKKEIKGLLNRRKAERKLFLAK